MRAAEKQRQGCNDRRNRRHRQFAHGTPEQQPGDRPGDKGSCYRALTAPACAVALTLALIAHPAGAQELKTGRSFSQGLTGSISGTVRGKPLRDVLTELGPSAGFAVVVDRRINPNRSVSVELNNATRVEAIRQVAMRAGADVAVLDNVLFVGPPTATRKLRTLIELRRKPVSRFNNRRTLRAGTDYKWPRLAEPRTILQGIAQGLNLNVPHAELPHDLWAAAAVPDVDAATAISIILIQFRLTFEWTDDGTAIQFAPVPERPTLKESLRITNTAPTNLVELARQQFPDARFTRSRSALQIEGTFEAIETTRRLARGELSTTVVRQPMRNQRFTMTAPNVPARAVLKKLVDAGNAVEWDEALIGSLLEKRIDIDVQQAPPEELFSDICRQIGVDFRVERDRVRLFPK